jgi:hypothetical protein
MRLAFAKIAFAANRMWKGAVLNGCFQSLSGWESSCLKPELARRDDMQPCATASQHNAHWQ